MPIARNQMYEEGQAAHAKGLPITENPYNQVSQRFEWRNWNGGWHNPPAKHEDIYMPFELAAADKSAAPVGTMQPGFYFWDTSDSTIYPEGGRYETLRDIQKVNSDKFFRRDYGEDIDNPLAIGYSDGRSFYSVSPDGTYKRLAAALPGTPRIAQGTSIDLYNGELIYVESEDGVEGLYCLPNEEEKYLGQGMRRISVQEEAWWYRETPASPEEVPQWYGPFEEQEEATAEIHKNIPNAEVQEIQHQRAAAHLQATALQAVRAHTNDAEAAQDGVLAVLLGVPSGYEPDDDQVSVF